MCADRRGEISGLSPDRGNEDREFRRYFADAIEFERRGRPDHEPSVAIAVPLSDLGSNDLI